MPTLRARSRPISSLVDNLERHHLAMRARDFGPDRRVVRVRLTDAGVEKLIACREGLEVNLTESVAQFESLVAETASLLSRIERSLGVDGAQPDATSS